MTRVMRLSLSLGGSTGSEADCLGGGDGGTFGFPITGAVSGLDFLFSFLISAAGGGLGAASSNFFLDEATWVTLSPDFEMTAILVPGSTTSPSFATNYQQLNTNAKVKNQHPIKKYINK